MLLDMMVVLVQMVVVSVGLHNNICFGLEPGGQAVATDVSAAAVEGRRWCRRNGLTFGGSGNGGASGGPGGGPGADGGHGGGGGGLSGVSSYRSDYFSSGSLGMQVAG